jgi:4-hydroxy 2-oxovalerate aldolase
MEWVSKRYYSINSIVRALNNASDNKVDNEKLSIFSTKSKSKSVFIVGGGRSVTRHQEAIYNFLSRHSDIPIIHASSKNAESFRGLSNEQFFCLVGNEGIRLEKIFGKNLNLDITCILPPYPRMMGTYIPEKVKQNTFELASFEADVVSSESVTVLALEIAKIFIAQRIYFVGYDGYSENVKREQVELFNENEEIFNHIERIKLISLTETLYKGLEYQSIYNYLK